MKLMHGILFTLSCLISSGLVNATSVLPLQLDRLYGDAAVVFYGECLSDQKSLDNKTGYHATVTRFKVIQPLKGEPRPEYTLKQFSGLTSDNAEAPILNQYSTQFIVGRRYVVFLLGESQLGFASPVGFNQGIFDVISEQGSDSVTNGRDFNELLQNGPTTAISQQVISPKQKTSKPLAPQNDSERAKMPLEQFLSIVRTMGETP